MAKIKVFKFEVSNWSSAAFTDQIGTQKHKNAQARLATEEKIESTIDDYIADKEVISINANTVDLHYHNNGRGNTIQLIYTILYS